MNFGVLPKVGFTGFFLFGVICLFCPQAIAQEGTSKKNPDGVQVGTIEFESTERAVTSYGDRQKESVEYFDSLSKKITSLSSTGSASVSDMSDNVTFHMTGVYMYCSLKYGACPFVLDAILETDIIKSRQNKKASCNAMKTFWRKWIHGDMNKRIRYLMPTGYANKKANFDIKDRPRYVKCSKTVAEEAKLKLSNKEFFSQRYSDDSQIVSSIKKTNLLLQTIEAKNINVFQATGSGGS